MKASELLMKLMPLVVKYDMSFQDYQKIEQILLEEKV
tara:strand:+ start:5198 stop:5308 length:111 start_codon:yes stop_codon:yes gene_type:complete